MKAVTINDFGDKEKLTLTEMDKPTPGEGEILVRIKATSVNPVDYKIRNGKFKGKTPHTFPVILGWDLAGIVEERGYSARRFEVGEEVWAYTRRPEIHQGTYAEYISLPESYLSKKPKKMEFDEAACIPLVGLTAYQSLFQAGNLQRNQHVLITGASGGVGTMAVQLAKQRGARITAIASGKNEGYVKNLGADHFIDYTNTPVEKITTEKADLVFDTVGGGMLDRLPQLTKNDGKVVSIAGKLEQSTLEEYQNINFEYVFVAPHSRQLDELRLLVESKLLVPHIQEVFSLNEIKIAHEKIETGHTRGKIAIRVQ